MITVQPFTLDVIKTYKCFYLLRHIADVSELQILHNTPAGPIETDVADAFSMPNGKIIVAWRNPLNIAPMHNLIALSGSTVENVNLTPIERVIDIYDRPVDAEQGTFTFTNSDMIIAPNLDWRCDNGKYGPRSFHPVTIIDDLPQIVVYEPLLSVNGIGHIIYIEGIGKQSLADHHVNNDTHPVTGRTLWETLKLVHEWAIVHEEPFNNTEAPAYKASQFIKELKLSNDELAVVDQQTSMQIANYLTGSTNARQRPESVLPITNDVRNILFSRLASSSVSFLEYMNPGMWDLQELLTAEQEELEIEKVNFEILKTRLSPDRPVIAIQHRIFQNKQLIMDKLIENSI